MGRRKGRPSKGKMGGAGCRPAPVHLPFPAICSFILLGVLGYGAIPPGASGTQADPVRDEVWRVQEAVDRQAPVRELLAIYRRMDDIRDVRIHLEDGILELSGTALSAEARTTAGEVAEGLSGIVWVDNRLLVETDLRKRMAPALERMEEKGLAFLRFLPSLLVGLLIVGISVVLAVWLGNRSFPFDRVAPNAFARNLLRQVVRTAVVLLGVLLGFRHMAVPRLRHGVGKGCGRC